MIDKIHEIARVLKEKEQIEREYYKLVRPIVRSVLDVSVIFGAMTAADISKDAKLFVILYLADPEVLVGKKIKRGKRAFIAKMYGYKSLSITVMVRNLMFRYEHYKDFRDEVERGMSIAKKTMGKTLTQAFPC